MEWAFIDRIGDGHARRFGTDEPPVLSVCGIDITDLLARPKAEWVERGGDMCHLCWFVHPE